MINNYPVFEKNQVLTSNQLNQLVKYLDQQNRLTRTSLTGLGIICGLEAICESSNTLTITRGVGVTSEGFLIRTGDCVTTRYRNYVLPAGTSYPPFEDLVSHQQDVTLSELLTEDAVVDQADNVVDLTDDFLKEKIVLLFLECLDKDLKSCLGKSCDELGIDRIFTLRKLLISVTDMDKVLARTNGGKPDAQYPDKLKLPPLAIPRPLFNPKSAEAQTYYGMGFNYLGSVWKHFGLLVEKLNESYNVYRPVLEDLYGTNPFSSSVLTDSFKDIKTYVYNFLAFEQPVYGVQYLYDFFKDLTLAYNEFREEAFDLTALCCPDDSRFPRHLMLGESCAVAEDCKVSVYRHYFVASPVLEQQQERLNRVKHLHKRLVLMLESFDLDRLLEPEQWESRITPSIEKPGWLSQRTIPYYYNSRKQSQFSGLGTLEKAWDFGSFRKCYPSDLPQQLSYDNHAPWQAGDHPIVTPLRFDLDRFTFLRTEGLLAKPLEEAWKQLRKQRSTHNLSFDIKAVYFGHLGGEGKRKRKCVYSDLQPDYSIWRNKALLFFNNMVKTNKNVEQVVMNSDKVYESARNMYTPGSAAKASGAKHEKTGGAYESKTKKGFDFAGIGNLMKSKTVLDFNTASFEISKLNTIIGKFSAGPQASKSASFESSRMTSIRGLFSDLNDYLLKLIKAIPVDFRDFQMDLWLHHYKCSLRMYIKLMKFLASEIKSPNQLLFGYFALLILCVLYRLVRFVAIYPYITIRVLYDTAQERSARLEESLRFARFLHGHPGLEHKAGVAPGQTLVLVYQLQQQPDDFEEGFREKLENAFRKISGEFSDEKWITGDFEFPDPPSPGQIIEVTSKMIGKVVADFTVPFVCCDDCGDMPHTPQTLDPLATPVCAVLSFVTNDEQSDDTLAWDYQKASIRLLNDLYDPSVYKVRLAVEALPNFGTAVFEDGIYDPDPGKKAQILKYTVDEAKIAQEMKVNDDLFFIDEFEYEIIDVSRNDEVVGSDRISVFIPVVQSQETRTATLTGQVMGVENQESTGPLEGATVKVKNTGLNTVTDDKGMFQIQGVPLGQQTVMASYVGYTPQEKQINVEVENELLTFILQPAQTIYINYARAYKVMGISENSADAGKVKAYYATNMSVYKNIADRIVKEEGSKEVTPLTKAKASIGFYAEDEDVNIVKLNNDFNKQRNQLVRAWQDASGSEKKLHAEMLKNLTGAYLDRLAFVQPGKLTGTTRETLRESANIFNSRKELGMKSALQEWNTKSRGFIPEEYRETINKELKLK